METMRKIPNYISSYIDESIDRALGKQTNIFTDYVDKRFNGLNKTFNDLNKNFNDLNKTFNDLHQVMIKEFRDQKGAILNEFDSRLKTFGEYIDTKTSVEDVRRIFHEEREAL